MEAVLKAIRDKKLKNVEPALIISSEEGAGAIEKAKRMGMDPNNILVIPPRKYARPSAFGKVIIEACHARRVNFVGQYGWLPKTPDNVIEEFEGMIINHHPGPLDPLTEGYDFGGRGMYGRRVLCARLRFVHATCRHHWTYATVHRVTSKLDGGEVICEKAIPLNSTDVETLLDSMRLAEQEAAIEVLGDFVKGVVPVIHRKPHWLVMPNEKYILNRVKDLAIKRYEDG